MELIRCEVTEGSRAGFKAIGVQSVEGFAEFFTIEDRFLVEKNGDYLLPVRVIGKDPRYGTLLIQLPVEADSGANRVWISGEMIHDKHEAIA